MSLVMNTIAFLVGGLGLFLMGMKFMSDGLQTVAGPSLKSLIGAVTNNRILGVLVGVLVTCLVQSSSITSVMVIGFVNAELMLLKQAIGVIMGANVGTTVTGWVLVLNIGKYGMPLAGIFGLIYCFVEKETVKHTALALLGLGLVFMGLEGMKNALEPLSESPEFCSFMTMFDASTFYGLVKCVLIGALLTAVLQSSSAMLGVTIAMAHQGLIGFESAAALVLGQNIGTTATAFLASIGTGRAARRAALFHIFFNVFGVLWVVVIFRPYLQFVQFVLEFVFHIPEPDVIKTVNGASIAPYMTASIATFHTIFNVANLFVLLPFTGLIAKGLEKLFKQKSVKRKVVATKLDYPLLTSPFAAITQSNREILLMNQTVKKMMSDLRISLTNGPETRKKQDAIFAAEAHLDLVQEEIANFLTNLLSNRASQTVANDAERQLRMSDDLETASDYITQVLKLHLRLSDKNVCFDEEHANGILKLHDETSSLVDLVQELLEQVNKDDKMLAIVRKQGFEITQLVRELRSMHWSHLAEAQYDPLVTTTYTDVLNDYRKIKEHLITAAETGQGVK